MSNETTRKSKSGQIVKIVIEEQDPLTTRVSIGGDKTHGYYIVVRAKSMIEAKHVVEEALSGFNELIKDSLIAVAKKDPNHDPSQN